MTFMTPTRTDFSNASAIAAATLRTMVVVPCFNEANRLTESVFLQTLAAAPHLSFVFVNDGSTDDTHRRLQALRLMNPQQIEVVNLRRNGGKAEAVRAGLQHACGLNAKVVGYWDADLATPLDAIADFETVMDRYDDVTVIFGARRQLLGHRINRTVSRRAVSRICAAMARLAVGLPIGDTQCGAKLLRNTGELRAAIAQPFTAGWLFDVELFNRIAATTAQPERRFYEMPLPEWHEIEGSKVSGRAIIRSGVQMLGLIAQRYAGKLRLPTRAADPTRAAH